MKVYSIRENQIIEAINKPDEILEGYGGTLVVHKLLNSQYLLRMVYTKEEEMFKIITVYPAKKERYWRKEK